MPSWELDDADAIAAAHKYTFYKPPAEIIAQVRPGETVKLIFVFESDDPEAPRAERMWVLVDAVNDDGSFAGRLDNQPQWIKDLQYGDAVRFDASHIINTEHDDDDNLVERYSKLCFVTNRLLKDDSFIALLDAPEGSAFELDPQTQEFVAAGS